MGKEKGTCLTGSKGSASVAGIYAGQHGFRRDKYLSPDTIDINDITGTSTLVKSELLMSMEFPYENVESGYQEANILSGFFVPPATNTYIFHATCDDKCILKLSQTDMSTNDAAEIINIASYATRGFYSDTSRTDLSSAEITLTGGNHYYMELLQVNTNSAGYAQVSVEIKNSPVTDHQNAKREVQYMQMTATNVDYDTTILTITNPDPDASFKIYFRDPDDNKPYTSDVSVNGRPTAWQVKQGIRGFFNSKYGSYVEVEREMEDVNGASTDVVADAVVMTFTVKMTKLISTTSARIAYTDLSHDTMTVAIATGAFNTPSSTPFSGSFKIAVPAFDGTTTYETADLDYSAGQWDIENAIFQADPNWRGNIIVELDNWSQYYDRKNIRLKFDYYKGDPGLFELESSADTPLAGPTYTLNTVVEQAYDGSVIFYTPIPYDMLKTSHLNPQILMTVDGLPVACRTIDCDYLYETAAAEITQQAQVSGSTLTITGTGFPDNVKKVEYADSLCVVTSISATQIVCTLENTPAAGLHYPKVTSYQGLIPINNAISKNDIALTISSVSPNSNVNPNGGTEITISGTGFPADLKSLPSDFAITFTDSTVCNVEQVSSTQIICSPDAFTSASSNVDLQLTLNAKTATSAVAVGTNTYSVLSVTPSSVSPVLKDTLIIEISTDQTIVASDFAVFLVNSADATKNKELNVFEEDNVSNPKTISARFGGAWSGTYRVQVVSNSAGRFSSTIDLDVSGTVTGISPTSGSVFGGTKVTITGTNFDDDGLNNPVNIDTEHCEIISSTPTEIVFRTPSTTSATGHAQESLPIIVALKTSEEAVCNDGGAGCVFEYASGQTPTITSATPSYSEADGYIKITFAGSGFGSSAELYLDGLEQEI